MALCGVVGMESPEARAQEDRKESIAGEQAATRATQRELPVGYNLHLGPVALRLEGRLRAEVTDNLLSANENRREDLIIYPEARVYSLWPITDINTLRLSLGAGYSYFVNTAELNSSAPLISPDSELALQVYVGDFRIKVREQFSYQEIGPSGLTSKSSCAPAGPW